MPTKTCGAEAPSQDQPRLGKVALRTDLTAEHAGPLLLRMEVVFRIGSLGETGLSLSRGLYSFRVGNLIILAGTLHARVFKGGRWWIGRHGPILSPRGRGLHLLVVRCICAMVDLVRENFRRRRRHFSIPVAFARRSVATNDLGRCLVV